MKREDPSHALLLWLAACLVLSTLPLGLLSPVQIAHGTTTTLSPSYGSFTNLVVDPARTRLYLSVYDGSSIIVLDTSSEQVIAEIRVGLGPTGMAISADDNQLYVTLATSGLAVVDLTSLTLTTVIPLTFPPSDVCAGRLGRAYVTAQGEVADPLVIDTNSSKEVGRITSVGPISGGATCLGSPDRQTLFIADTQLEPSTIFKFSIATDNISLTSKSPFSTNPAFINDLAISPDDSRLYVSAGGYNIDIRNTTDWTSLGRLATGNYPTSVALAEQGRLVFAAHSPYPNQVTVYNATTFLPITNFTMGAHSSYSYPILVRASIDGSRAFVLEATDLGIHYGQLAIIDTRVPSWSPDSSLKAVSSTPTSIDLAWSGASGIGLTEYRLFQGGVALGTFGASIRTYNVTGLKPDTDYTFRVQAGDTLGNWSADGPLLDTLTAPTASTSSSAAPGPALGQTFPWEAVYVVIGMTAVIGVILFVVIWKGRSERTPYPLPTAPPSPPTPTYNPNRRPLGLSMISILWFLAGLYDVYLSASALNDDAGIYPLLSSLSASKSHLTTVQLSALSWLQSFLPLHIVLSILILILSLVQLSVAYGWWNAMSWSYKAGLVVLAVVPMLDAIATIVYYSAPPVLKLANPELIGATIGSIVALVVVGSYLRRERVKLYLLVFDDTPTTNADNSDQPDGKTSTEERPVNS